MSVGLVFGVVLASEVAAGSAPQCFLKIEGVIGNATEKYHKDWIQVHDYTHRIQGLPTPSILARVKPIRTYGKAITGKFIIIKERDRGSQELSKMCAGGIRIPEVRVEQRWLIGNKYVYMAYRLTNVFISSYEPGGSGSSDDVPVEEVTFNYGNIEFEYTETDHKTGKAKGNIETEWDVDPSEKEIT